MSIPSSGPSGQLPTAPALFPDPVPGLISFASVNILAGASNVGKTCLISSILSAVQRSAPIFGLPTCAPPAIGFVCADRDRRIAQHWLELAGCAPIGLYSLVEDFSFDPIRLLDKPRLVPALEGMIEKLTLPRGSLVVVDPLSLFLGSTNDYHAAAAACLRIRRMCQRLGLTLLGTAHASKQIVDARAQYKRLQDRILGSTAQLGYTDTQMYLASPIETDEKFYTFLWHSHAAEAQTFQLSRDADGMFIPWLDGVQAKEEGRILQAITTEAEGTPLAAIHLAAGASKATVHRYLQELQRIGVVVKVRHGVYRRAQAN